MVSVAWSHEVDACDERLRLNPLIALRRSFEDIEVSDLCLLDFMAIRNSGAVYLPHTGGRYQTKRFRKASCPIVERLVVCMMFHGRNAGKKLMAVRIVKHCFDIIHLLTDQNPIQVLVQAIVNAGPREDSTRVGAAGIVRRQVSLGCLGLF